MRVGDYVLVNHGRYRWKIGRIMSPPTGLENNVSLSATMTLESKWLVELATGPQVEIRGYQLEIVSSLE